MTARIPLVFGSDGVPQQLQAADTLAAGAAPVNAQTGTTYTLGTGDNGGIVVLTNAAAITVTVPASLPAGFSCTLIQGGAGAVAVTAAAGASISNQDGYSKTTGQNGVMSLFVIGNSGGAAAQAILAGARA